MYRASIFSQGTVLVILQCVHDTEALSALRKATELVLARYYDSAICMSISRSSSLKEIDSYIICLANVDGQPYFECRPRLRKGSFPQPSAFPCILSQPASLQQPLVKLPHVLNPQSPGKSGSPEPSTGQSSRCRVG